MNMTSGKTHHGFSTVRFEDHYGEKCSIQKSSLATEDAIWFGCDNANPQIMARNSAAHGVTTSETCGWVPYPIPDDVLLNTRMHLTRDQVAELLPTLKHFAETGELPA